MEQIEQLKAMRDAAKVRIEATPDYKLMHSLTALIDDLEEALGLSQQDDGAAEAESAADEDEASAEPAEPEPSIEADDGEPDELRPSMASGGVEQAEEAYAAAANGSAEQAESDDVDPLETVEAVAEAISSSIEQPADEADVGAYDAETAQVAAEIERALKESAEASGAGDGQAEALMDELAAAADISGDGDDADAISKAMEELDADLANTKFNV